MIAQSNSPYTIAAAARILGVAATAIREVRGAFNCLLVVFRHQRAQFVSTAAFLADFETQPIVNAAKLPGEVHPQGNNAYLIRGSKGDLYAVDLNAGSCDCADHIFRGRRCKHIVLAAAYAAVEAVGVDELATAPASR